MEVVPTIFWYSKQINSYVTQLIPSVSSFHYHDNVLHLVTLLSSYDIIEELRERRGTTSSNYIFFGDLGHDSWAGARTADTNREKL